MMHAIDDLEAQKRTHEGFHEKVDLEMNSVERKHQYTGDGANVAFFGVKIDKLSRPSQFAICSGGVFFFYLLYGYFQELIFSLDGFKPYGWYLTLVQFLYYTLFSIAEWKIIVTDHKRRIPLSIYGILALLTVGTMGLSNTSLGYLNYPTQVIFKCCKLIPVMIGGILIQGKKYTLLDFMACCLMSLGLIVFTLADSHVSPVFNHTGVILISLALCADAAIGNVQEKAMKKYNAGNAEVVLYSYGIGFFYILFGLLITGIWEPFVFCFQHPVQTYGYAFLFALSGYLGITFVLTLIRTFGALPTVTVTTCRKAVTITLSFFLFTKPFTMQYLFGGFIVLAGLALNIVQKNNIDIWRVPEAAVRWFRCTKGLYRGRRKSMEEV